MSDLIRRQDAIDACRSVADNINSPTDQQIGAEYCLDLIKEIPYAEPERTAKVRNQIFNNSHPYTIGAWLGICECGELVSYTSKYCHMCGAKLDWSGNE